MMLTAKHRGFVYRLAAAATSRSNRRGPTAPFPGELVYEQDDYATADRDCATRYEQIMASCLKNLLASLGR